LFKSSLIARGKKRVSEAQIGTIGTRKKTILVYKKVIHLNRSEKKFKVWLDSRSSLVQYQIKMKQKMFSKFCYLIRVEHKNAK
jgi:hypothetical protein